MRRESGMAEETERRNHPIEERESSVEDRLWRVTATPEECARRRAEQKERFDKLVSGLERCPVCGGKASAGTFGAREYGVWVGCKKSWRCSRNMVLHTEGWSLEEAAAVWNFYNGKPIVWLRKAKMWLEEKFGKYGREERKLKKRILEAKREKIETMARIFGISKPEKAKSWKEKAIFCLKFWKKREK